MAKGIEQELDHWVPPCPLNNDYPNKFNLKCIATIEDLKTTLQTYIKPDGTYPLMGFDTETTGLNPEEDSIVGYSFAFNDIDAYYVPINHVNFGLGDQALDIIYDVMCKSSLVLMYNARFDIRMMEWNHFEDETLEFKKEFIEKARMWYKYDMNNVKTYDVQVLVWATYTKHYMPKLKWAELQFLGWRSQTFSETQGSASNFAYLDPLDPNTYVYAATDAIALILLYNKLKWMRDEGKVSLQMHASGKLMPLTRFEETPIMVDLPLLRRQSEYFHTKLNEVEQRIYNIVGYPFNISSGPARAKAFKDKNIIITEKTSSGAVATGADVIENAKKKFEKDSDQYILLDLCTEFLHLRKMISTYIDSLLEQTAEHEYRPGLFRYSYRNTSTTSGRYSGGTWD